ncbi:MAG TPA: acyloxyacyl hydrolase [Lichenihabitans sp.]|nr:acyloxyacyl hydrolase [Lichenihabitans sp.]
MLKRFLLSSVCIVLTSLPVAAADLPTDHFQPPAPAVLPQTPVFYDYELRIGGLAHDPLSPEHGSADLNAEILFPKFWHASNSFWDQFIPHPDLGFTANFAGKTSNLYGGAAWNFDITERFFVSGEFGPGLNNGETGHIVSAGHNKVGCNVWFHESASGGYRLTERWSIMATIEHSSNAGICSENRGLTNYGLRVGYRF